MKKAQAQAALYAKHNEIKSTDYLLLKHLDGELTATEYKPHKERRAALRTEIRALEDKIKTIEGGK